MNSNESNFNINDFSKSQLEEIQNGVPVKDIRNNIMQEYGEIPDYFASFEAKFKDLNR